MKNNQVSEEDGNVSRLNSERVYLIVDSEKPKLWLCWTVLGLYALITKSLPMERIL
jgi:hypothetical protein